MNESVSAFLLASRVNRGWSIRRAAIEIGIDRRTLERAEQGELVSPAAAKKIADAYGRKVTDLWAVEDWAA